MNKFTHTMPNFTLKKDKRLKPIKRPTKLMHITTDERRLLANWIWHFLDIEGKILKKNNSNFPVSFVSYVYLDKNRFITKHFEILGLMQRIFLFCIKNRWL